VTIDVGIGRVTLIEVKAEFKKWTSVGEALNDTIHETLQNNDNLRPSL